jgi:hypothetical protein
VRLQCPPVRGQPDRVAQAFDVPPPLGAIVSFANTRARGMYIRYCAARMYVVSYTRMDCMLISIMISSPLPPR